MDPILIVSVILAVFGVLLVLTMIALYQIYKLVRNIEHKTIQTFAKLVQIISPKTNFSSIINDMINGEDEEIEGNFVSNTKDDK